MNFTATVTAFDFLSQKYVTGTPGPLQLTCHKQPTGRVFTALAGTMNGVEVMLRADSAKWEKVETPRERVMACLSCHMSLSLCKCEDDAKDHQECEVLRGDDVIEEGDVVLRDYLGRRPVDMT